MFVTQGMYAEQQNALEAVYLERPPAGLSPARKQAYWGERLDGLLLWADYNNRQVPVRDFGLAVAGGSEGPDLARWQAFLKDFSAAYPASGIDTSRFDPAAISAQLRIVAATLKRPVDR